MRMLANTGFPYPALPFQHGKFRFFTLPSAQEKEEQKQSPIQSCLKTALQVIHNALMLT